MKKRFGAVLLILCLLCLAGCGNARRNEQKTQSDSLEYGFENAIPAEVSDAMIQNCTRYAEDLGYQTGEMKKAALLGEDRIASVYCEEDDRQNRIDAEDIVVIFENIRCVVDAETEIVLGRIPFV